MYKSQIDADYLTQFFHSISIILLCEYVLMYVRMYVCMYKYCEH